MAMRASRTSGAAARQRMEQKFSVGSVNETAQTRRTQRICEQKKTQKRDDVPVMCTEMLRNERLRSLVVSSFGLSFADYPAALGILFQKFLENSADIAEIKKVDPLAELRAAHDATLLNTFPHLKARLVSLGASACGSASWLSDVQ